jgi:hypothetical protein
MDHLDTCINLNSTVIGGEDEYKTPVLAKDRSEWTWPGLIAIQDTHHTVILPGTASSECFIHLIITYFGGI